MRRASLICLLLIACGSEEQKPAPDPAPRAHPRTDATKQAPKNVQTTEVPAKEGAFPLKATAADYTDAELCALLTPDEVAAALPGGQPVASVPPFGSGCAWGNDKDIKLSLKNYTKSPVKVSGCGFEPAGTVVWELCEGAIIRVHTMHQGRVLTIAGPPGRSYGRDVYDKLLSALN